jgi:hypothetical protein
MKELIIYNLPQVFSEKDLFLHLVDRTAGIRRIMIADDPEVKNRTMNVAVCHYNSFEEASSALQNL